MQTTISSRFHRSLGRGRDRRSLRTNPGPNFRAAGSVRNHRADPSRDPSWLPEVDARRAQYLFPSRFRAQPHLSTRQYARIVHSWVESAWLDSSAYGTHSMRRTKVSQIYKKTGNLRAVQLLLGHTKLESTVRYLGIEVDDALSISEQVEL
jgi:integrase